MPEHEALGNRFVSAKVESFKLSFVLSMKARNLPSSGTLHYRYVQLDKTGAEFVAKVFTFTKPLEQQPRFSEEDSRSNEKRFHSSHDNNLLKRLIRFMSIGRFKLGQMN